MEPGKSKATIMNKRANAAEFRSRAEKFAPPIPLFSKKYPVSQNKHLYKKTVFSASMMHKYMRVPKRKYPARYILIYSDEAEDFVKQKYTHEIIKIHSILNIILHKKIGFVKMTGIGSPHAASIMEELISLGGNQFLNIGTAGGLKQKGVFLCDKALRDEGTSYHYIKPSKFAFPDKKLTLKLGECIKSNELHYSSGTTWTTDATFRETAAEVKAYAEQGIATVEMEAAALFAVGQYRKVKTAAAFVVSDLLCDGKWNPMFNDVEIDNTLTQLIESAVDCLS